MSRLPIRFRGDDWILSDHGYIEPAGPEPGPHEGRIPLAVLSAAEWQSIVEDTVAKRVEEACPDEGADVDIDVTVNDQNQVNL